jgi:hypothetical protein
MRSTENTFGFHMFVAYSGTLVLVPACIAHMHSRMPTACCCKISAFLLFHLTCRIFA